MAKNGYSDLHEGPQSGWLGYYSLDKQGRMDNVNLEELIAANADDGLVWTDPTVRCYDTRFEIMLLLHILLAQVDPTLCGHVGHAARSCGLTFSYCVQDMLAGGKCSGRGMGPAFIP